MRSQGVRRPLPDLAPILGCICRHFRSQRGAFVEVYFRTMSIASANLAAPAANMACRSRFTFISPYKPIRKHVKLGSERCLVPLSPRSRLLNSPRKRRAASGPDGLERIYKVMCSGSKRCCYTFKSMFSGVLASHLI